MKMNVRIQHTQTSEGVDPKINKNEGPDTKIKRNGGLGTDIKQMKVQMLAYQKTEGLDRNKHNENEGPDPNIKHK